jgi:glutamyl/glutaminyl-tRNA synthetase
MESSGHVVTRFAPSPTGYLHVGGARTALFNWAYARHHGGRFILRIEDTDQLRSSEESTRKILQDLAWLGIDWDEGPDPSAPDCYTKQTGERGPYFQSQRLSTYREYVQRLLDSGSAYEAFESPEELAKRREAAIREGGSYRYDRERALALSKEQIQKFKAEGKPYVVRFLVPEKTFTVDDQILGPVSTRSSEIEDFVLLKADGFPTYNFAVVVDDLLMGVTDVLRGQEHLGNTPKQIALYEALQAPLPRFAHLPLIFNPDGTKMSKRDKGKAAREAARNWLRNTGAAEHDLAVKAGLDEAELQKFLQKRADDVSTAAAIARAVGVHLPEIDVHDFRASGYLPETLVKYLALLGWSPKNDREDIDAATLAQTFDFSGIGRSSARFDRVKLLAFNADTIQHLPGGDFQGRLRGYFAQFYPDYLRLLAPDQFARFATMYQERARTLAEPAEKGQFFISDDSAIRYEPAAVRKVLLSNDAAGLRILKDLLPHLQAVEQWSMETLERMLDEFMQAQGIGLGKIGQPLRVAISGGTVTPPLHDTLVVLGKERVIKRIEGCIEVVSNQQDRAIR